MQLRYDFVIDIVIIRTTKVWGVISATIHVTLHMVCM